MVDWGIPGPRPSGGLASAPFGLSRPCRSSSPAEHEGNDWAGRSDPPGLQFPPAGTGGPTCGRWPWTPRCCRGIGHAPSQFLDTLDDEEHSELCEPGPTMGTVALGAGPSIRRDSRNEITRRRPRPPGAEFGLRRVPFPTRKSSRWRSAGTLPLATAEHTGPKEALRPGDQPDSGLTHRSHHRPVPGLPSRPR